MKRYKYYIFLLAVLSLLGCKEFLDEPADKNKAVISTVNDLQLLMDYGEVLNSLYPNALEIQADNYYLKSSIWNSLPNPFFKNLYTWTKDELQSEIAGQNDYANAYQVISTANIVIEAAKEMSPLIGEQDAYDNAVSSAHFIRAYYLLALSQLFIPPYNNNSAASDLGLALRVDPDFNTPSVRSSVEKTYQFIISEFKFSLNKLPLTPLVKTRPSRPAAYGALARTYLYMNDFANAKLYADSCLALYSELIDFNTLNKNAPAPFVKFNKEVLFHMRSSIYSGSPLRPTRAIADPELYASYASKDLRKFLFYRTINNIDYLFKGDYEGRGGNNSGYVFGGIATDEIYLIRAEAKARTGDVSGAMQDLNTILITRWETGSYVPLIATSQDDALKSILEERRKELIYRGTRWSDIRRLTGVYQIIPKRVIDDKVFTLEPGNLRYVMPFPREVITLSEMQQNP